MLNGLTKLSGKSRQRRQKSTSKIRYRRRLARGLELLENRRLLAVGGWSLIAGGVDGGQNDRGYDVAHNDVGNSYVTGSFVGDADFDGDGVTDASSGSQENSDIFVAKYDATGSLKWVQSAGGTLHDSGKSIAYDGSSGTVFVGGRMDYSPDSVGHDFYLTSLDSETGATNWSKQLPDDGSGDEVKGVAVDGNGNVYATGEFDGTLDFGGTTLTSRNDSRDIFVAKFDASGAVQWAQRAGSDVGGESGEAIVVGGAGDVYVGGGFKSSKKSEADFGNETLNATDDGSNFLKTEPRDGFISKLDSSNGAFLWTKQIGGSGGDVVSGIAIDDAAGAVFSTGQFNEEAFAGDVTITSNGSYDGFVTKQDTNGNFLWADAFGGTEHDEGGYKLAVRANGDVTVTGAFVQEGYFGDLTLTNPAHADRPDGRYTSSFYATADSQGSFHTAGLIQPGIGRGVSVDGNDNVYLTGEAYNDGQFDPSFPFPTGEELITDGYDIYLTKVQSGSPPTATDDSYTTDEDTQLSVAAAGVLDNDSDDDGDPLTASLVSGPANGTVTLNSDGSFTYDPDPDYNGSDSFVYAAEDGNGGSSEATVSLTVNPVNDAPTAADDAYTGTIGDTLTVAAPGLLENDTDVDGDALTVNTTAVSGPSNGTLSLQADGSFDYTPDSTSVEKDSFTYELSDGKGGLDTATVALSFTQPPTADAVSAATDEDTAVEVTLSGSDQETVELTFEIVTGPASGSLGAITNQAGVSGSPNTDTALVIYTPDANYNGSDSFTYRVTDTDGASAEATVSLTINPLNDAPVASTDAYAMDQDTTLMVDAPGLLANDSDVDGDSLTVDTTPVSGPTDGTLTLGTDGSFEYSPNAGFTGQDSFKYQISDGNGATDTAVVTIDVNSTITTLHVGDLDGTAINQGKHWKAEVTITVLDGAGDPVGNATVDGTWSGGYSGAASATTDSSGQAVVTSGNIRKNTDSTSWTVDSITHSSLTYDSTDNTDPDGDSSGTSITVFKDGTTTAGQALLAADHGHHHHDDGQELTQSLAQSAVSRATHYWSERLDREVSTTIDVHVTDLPSGQLGWAEGAMITLDVDASGEGWNPESLNMAARHEVGHVLGFGHQDHGVMAQRLRTDNVSLVSLVSPDVSAKGSRHTAFAELDAANPSPAEVSDRGGSTQSPAGLLNEGSKPVGIANRVSGQQDSRAAVEPDKDDSAEPKWSSLVDQLLTAEDPEEMLTL